MMDRAPILQIGEATPCVSCGWHLMNWKFSHTEGIRPFVKDPTRGLLIFGYTPQELHEIMHVFQGGLIAYYSRN